MDMKVANFDLNDPIWRGIPLALLLGIAMLVAWPPLQKILAHRYMQRLISRLGIDSLRHISLMDGADVPLYIEYLILRSDGLLLLIVKPFRGNIFAAEKIENWTQVFRHRSFKFGNPLHELETNLLALRGMLPEINIRGLVIFTQGAVFPKGKPDNVCNFEELKQLASQRANSDIPDSLRQIWGQLSDNVQRDKRLNPTILYQKGDKRRLFLGTFLLFGCLIYLAWVLGWLQGIA